MGRRYGIPLTILALGLLIGGPAVATAGVPDPQLSTIPNVVGVPGGGLIYSVTIVGSSGPIDSANVSLVWTTAGDTAACWCTIQPHPSVAASTNASGVATFNLQLGGCLDPATIPGGVAVEVFVNSIKIKEVGQVSPDLVSVTSPPCQVALADGVAITPALSSGTYSFCTDLNSDLVTGLTDAVAVTPFLSTGASCN
jgi:hypothetical protein